jgi:hypothetical protein
MSFFGRLFKQNNKEDSDDPDKIIARQIDNWLRNNSTLLGSLSETNEVRNSLPLSVLLSFIAGANVMKCNEELSVFSQYISIPENRYSLNLTLCPFTFERAREYFYSLYPGDGFRQYMEKKVATSIAADLDKNDPHKTGVIFVLICLCPALVEKTYISVTPAIYPFDKSRRKIILPF